MKTSVTIFISTVLLLTNFGVNAQLWNQINSGSSSALHHVYFSNDTIGYIAGDGLAGPTFLKTIDGGSNWNPMSINTIDDIISMTFGSSSTGYVATSDKELYKSSNAGATWNFLKNFRHYIDQAYFINADTGFVTTGLGDVFRTLDGGSTWDSTANPGYHNTMTIQFTSTQIGYMGNYWGAFRKTTDMGNTWVEISQPTNNIILDIDFLSDDVGYAVGSQGLILMTTDGAQNWSLLPMSQTAYNEAVQFTSQDTGYIAGNGVWKTVDGGTNWIQEHYNAIDDMYFSSSNVGYAVGYDGYLIKYGSVPIGINSAVSSTSSCFFYPNPNTGLFVIESREYQSVLIHNSLGAEIAQVNVNSGRNPIDIVSQPPGIYFITSLKDGKVMKLIKY